MITYTIIIYIKLKYVLTYIYIYIHNPKKKYSTDKRRIFLNIFSKQTILHESACIYNMYSFIKMTYDIKKKFLYRKFYYNNSNFEIRGYMKY